MAEITLNGERRELRFTYKSMRKLEKYFGKSFNKIANEELQSQSLESINAVIWSSLINEDKKLTVVKVEDMISDSIESGELTMSGLGEAMSETMNESTVLGAQDQDGEAPEEETEQQTEGDDVKN